MVLGHSVGGMAIVLGVACGAFADEFAYRFPADQVLRYRVKATRVYKFTDGTTTGSVEVVWELSGGADSAAPLRARIRDLKLILKGGEEPLAFDSAKPPAAAAIARDKRLGVLAGLRGDGPTLAITRRGLVPDLDEEVRGLLRRGSTRGLPPGSGSAGGASLWTVARDLLAGMALRVAFVGLPDQANKGAQGTDAFEIWQTAIERHVTLTSLAGGKAEIAVGGTFAYEDHSGPVKGLATFDTEAGRLTTSKGAGTIPLSARESISRSWELSFEKALPLAEAGPESFEKPLPAGVTLIERRVGKIKSDVGGISVYADAGCETVAFGIAKGDVFRVVERPTGESLKVVDAWGRAGWVKVKHTLVAK